MGILSKKKKPRSEEEIRELFARVCSHEWEKPWEKYVYADKLLDEYLELVFRQSLEGLDVEVR